jgi:hypothetical protein
MKELKTFAIVFLFSLGMMIGMVNCNGPRDKNDMGIVEILPKGNYIIWNSGSRHIVKCAKDDGKTYWLNDADFQKNGIDGYDAHQYHDKTKITIE